MTTDPIDDPNRLTFLKTRIRETYAKGTDAARKSIAYFMDVGDDLREVKQRPDLEHGKWIDWVDDNCLFDVRTAQNYMRLAKLRPQIEAEYTTLAYLTVNAVLANALLRDGRTWSETQP